MVQRAFLRLALVFVLFLVPVASSAESVLVQIPDLGPNTTQMAKLEGNGWFEIDSFSMGLENEVEMSSGSARASGRARFTPITLNRRFDGMSPRLAETCATGKPIDQVTLYVIKGRRLPLTEATLAKIELKGVHVESVQLEGSDGVSEEIVLQAGAVQVHAYAQNAEGANAAQGKPFMWSQIFNKAVFQAR